MYRCPASWVKFLFFDTIGTNNLSHVPSTCSTSSFSTSPCFLKNFNLAGHREAAAWMSGRVRKGGFVVLMVFVHHSPPLAFFLACTAAQLT